ncbi:MAG: phosphotyrosine protein phosphatase [Actinobacteria bacterium]|nr:phosphotyrosine protein phosphatase [Actinomycetota bacterium]
MRVLFLCDRNRLRSPTAQAVFGDDPRLEVRSAGVRSDAVVGITRELLEWADVIFVMEKSQRNVIRKRFEDVYQSKRIVCLYIPDEFDLMDPVLVRLLTERVAPHLAAPGP